MLCAFLFKKIFYDKTCFGFYIHIYMKTCLIKTELFIWINKEYLILPVTSLVWFLNIEYVNFSFKWHN